MLLAPTVPAKLCRPSLVGSRDGLQSPQCGPAVACARGRMLFGPMPPLVGMTSRTALLICAAHPLKGWSSLVHLCLSELLHAATLPSR